MIYSDRAELYARYRWDYAPEAVQAIFQQAGLNKRSALVDLGAGTGIGTRHFVGRVGQVWAVEPDPGMRRILARDLGHRPGCSVLATSAEHTGLPDGAADLVVAAQAIHWFEPEPARREIARIIRPGGWLAVLNNRGCDAALGQAIAAISTSENGVEFDRAAPPGLGTPLSVYFGSDDFCHMAFPIALQEDWETFWGALCSASYMPTPRHPAYPRLETAARAVFARFSQDGRIDVRGETELWIGKVTGDEVSSAR